VTVLAEFPGTSLICMSNLPNKYSFLVPMPEPEYLSMVSVILLPPSCMVALLSPNRILKSVLKFPPYAIVLKLKHRQSKRKIELLAYEEAIINLCFTLCKLIINKKIDKLKF
jgi:hypothetical protein